MERLQRVTAPTLDVLSLMLERAAERGGPVFGLEIMKACGRPSGTIYPILERLEKQGWVRSEWEQVTDTQLRRRRLYEFTPEGADAAREVCAQHPRPSA